MENILRSRILFGFSLFLVVFAQSQTNFVDDATNLGIGVVTGDTAFGNGVSFFDYDNDGWDDITLGTELGQPLRFFKNVNGVFVEEFLNVPDNTSQVKQINWVDIDNDGDSDLFVASNLNGNKLYLNDGELTFTDVTAASQLPITNMFTFGASWGDYDNDGYLDVFLCNKDPNYLQPNYLYRNNGNGTFSDVSAAAGILNTSNLTLCAGFLDFNNDGKQDIYVSNDRFANVNVLYKNNGDGTFTDVSVSSNTNLSIDAMSVTVEDYNSDGFLDIYVTNTAGGNVFLKNNGDETFTNEAVNNGTAFYSIGWSAVFLDAENDMDLDLYVSGALDGSVAGLLSAAYYENDGLGMFSIPSAGFVNDTRESYSNAIGDIDNDGLPDIVVNNIDDENIFIWKNETITSNNWLKVKLEGVSSNADGIGSFIEISINGNKQYRYTMCGEGYLSQNSGSEVFGLGSNTSVDYIKVKWLSGIEDTFFNVSANQEIEITEGASTLTLNEYHHENVILMYPNPVQNSLNISAKSTIDNVSIFNSLGQEVLKVTPNSIKSSINVSHLKVGVYMIKMDIRGFSSVRKIIKY